MRSRLRLALLASTGVLALGAPSASAQLAASNEATGQQCSTFLIVIGYAVQGGCRTHVVSTQAVFLQGHFLGVETGDSVCDNEFMLVSDAGGNGYVIDQELTEPPAAGTTCTRRACTASVDGLIVKIPWEVDASEFGGASSLEVDFCVENFDGSSDLNCHLTVPFVETGDHDYEFGTLSGGNPVEIPCEGDSPLVIRGEVTGHWVTEATGQTELAH